MKNVEKIKNLTNIEKTALVAGTGNMYTNPVPRLGIPGLTFADGPHGLRKQISESAENVSKSEPATAFPTAVTLSSGWNENNAYAMGLCIGEECRHYGVNVLLGPGVNIKRNPLGGRNFEYYSEDPLLTGNLASHMVDGVQSKGVGVCVKHFALNQAENYRLMGNSVCDERAMREIYLKAFERIVKNTKPASIMCAYNKVNGEHCSQNEWLLGKVLRKEWGFDGLVMSDWGAVQDRVKGVKSGLDLEMPGDTAFCRRKLLDSLSGGSLTEEELDVAVERVLNLIDRTHYTELGEVDFSAHHSLAGDIAADCAVLMKNDGILPLNRKERVFVVGELFENMRYQGAGSSQINPTMLTTPKDAFDRAKIDYDYAKGYSVNETAADYDLVEQAVVGSAVYDKVVIFAGLTDDVESEGQDRESLSLPENQLALIDAIVETGVKTVVVLFGGSVSETPYSDKVSAILNMFLPGQNGGSAVEKLLFGKVSPSGKLSESWVESLSDVPCGDSFGKSINEIYRESVYVGYRYYLTANRKVKFPFGYGLSYTEFKVSEPTLFEDDDKIVVSCTVQNVGEMDGGEVVQVYVSAPESTVFKPKKELRGFKKVYLKSDESQRVEIVIEKSELRYYNIQQERWVLENGEYKVDICKDSETVLCRLSYYERHGQEVSSPYTERVSEIYKKAEVEKVDDEIFEEMSGLKIPETPKTKPFTVESRVGSFREGVMGRLIYKIIVGYADKKISEAEKIEDPVARAKAVKGAKFVKANIESNSLRGMSMCDKRLPMNYAEGIVALTNWRFIKAIGCFCKKIRVPKLPKDKGKKR